MKRLWAPWRMEYIMDESEKKEQGCIFCQFPKQGEDAQNLIVYRSHSCFVILNKYPYNNGHAMVVPYQHTGDILELNNSVLLDIQQTIQKTVQVLRTVMSPHALNIGMNLGRSAGAGIDAHLHYHIVPRWEGDTNFMPVLAETKVVSEGLKTTYKKVSAEFKKLFT